jgi:LemA protein
MVFNVMRETFPNVLFAGAFGFTPAALLEIEDPTQRAAPKVQF